MRKSINLLIFFFFLVFTFILDPTQAQEKLDIDGDLIVQSSTGPPRHGFVLMPQSAEPNPPHEGQVYFQDNSNRLRYYANGSWREVGNETYVATKIVAAYNSKESIAAGGGLCAGNGSSCTNIQADEGTQVYTCDGVDDQQTIQKAIDDLGSNAGAVYLLEGEYRISGRINLDNLGSNDSGKALIGTGKGTVLKQSSSTTSYRVIYASSVSNLLISQLMIKGNKISSGASRGIEFNGVSQAKIEKVWFEDLGDMTSGTVEGVPIWLDNSSYNSISYNHIHNNRGGGIHLEDSSNHNIISYNDIQRSGFDAIAVMDSHYNIVSYNNVWQWGNEAGIRISSAFAPSFADNNMIVGNNVQGRVYGIFTGSAGSILQNAIISGNNVQDNNGLAVGSLTRLGIALTGTNQDTLISANTITGHMQDGMYLVCQNSLISGNLLYENATDDINLYSGITIGGGMGGNSISSNRIYSSAGVGYGIYNWLGSDHHVVTNLINGAAYLGVGYDRRIAQGSGLSGNKYTDKLKMTLERAVVAVAADDTLDVSSSPKGYIVLRSNQAITLKGISDGKAAGDILILEGAGWNNGALTITIPSSAAANTILSNNQQRVLSYNDVLTLLWNGNDWVEMAYAHNSQ